MSSRSLPSAAKGSATLESLPSNGLLLSTLLTLLITILAPSLAPARDCTWIGATGDWETPGSWSCTGGVTLGPPGPTDAAIINSGTVTVNIPAVVAELHLASTLNLDANLTVTEGGTWGPSTLNGSGTELIIGPSAVMNTGSAVGVRTVNTTLRNQGNLNWTLAGWYTSGTGTIVNNADFLFGGGQASVLNNPLVNTGTFRLQSTSGDNLLVGGVTNSGTIIAETGSTHVSGTTMNTGTIRIEGTAVFRYTSGNHTFSPGSDFEIVGGNPIEMTSGTFNIEGDVTWDFPVNFAGTLNVADGLTLAGPVGVTTSLTVNGPGDFVLAESGTLTVTGSGILTLNTELINNGDATWQRAGWYTSGTGTIVNNADFLFGGGQASVLNNPLVNTGTFRLQSTSGDNLLVGGVTNSGTIIAETGSTHVSGTTMNTGTIRMEGTTTFRYTSGNHTFSPGSDFEILGANPIEMTAGTFNVEADATWGFPVNFAGTLNVADELTLAGPVGVTATLTVNGPGDFVLAESGTLTVTGNGILTLNTQLINNGDFVWQRAGWYISGTGTVVNNADFLFGGGQASSFTNPLVNTGTFRLQSTSGDNTLSGGITNSGTIIADTGSTHVSGTTENSGMTRVEEGATLTFTSGTHTFTSLSTVQIEGLLNANAGTIQFLGTITSQSGTLRSATSFNMANAQSVALHNLTINGGSLTPPSVLPLTGNLTATATGFLHNSGAIVFEGPGEQLLTLDVATTFHDLIVTEGTTLREISNGTRATVSGTLVNNGTISIERTLSATGSHPFGLTRAVISLNSLSEPTTVSVAWRGTNHPEATSNQKTGNHWEISAGATTYEAGLTLPHFLPAPVETASICWLPAPGGSWNCAEESFTDLTASRTGLANLNGVWVPTGLSEVPEGVDAFIIF